MTRNFAERVAEAIGFVNKIQTKQKNSNLRFCDLNNRMFTGTWNNRIECFYKSNIFDPLFGSTFHNKTKRAFKKKSEKSRKKNFSTDETRVLREMWERKTEITFALRSPIPSPIRVKPKFGEKLRMQSTPSDTKNEQWKKCGINGRT